MNPKAIILIGCMLVISSLANVSRADDNNGDYEISVTNITSGQTFTPILVLTHKKDVKLFTPGSPATQELAMLAEGGDTGPLTMRMSMNPDVGDILTSTGLLGSGETATLSVVRSGDFKYISLAAMILPSNDGFIALNGVKVPKGNKTVMYVSPAYDAGTESNDESCDHVPGPFGCDGSGEGYNDDDDAEGFVHVHSGIHGIGELDAAVYDWKNPIARIVIKRVGDEDDDEDEDEG